MSGFLGTTGGSDGGIPFQAKDVRLIPVRYSRGMLRWYFYEDAYTGGGDLITNCYWPGGSGLDASGSEWLRAESRGFEPIDVNTGAIAKRGFSGYTRDVNGVAIGGVTVRLFRTSDGLMTCQVVSGSDGFFTLDTQFYPDTHFYTAHKADVPEIAGASPSTLVAG